MRFATVLTSASLLSSASATYHRRQQLPGFPDCADNCLNNPTNLGGCQLGDETCLCKSLPFVETTVACIMAACKETSDQQTAISGAESLCLNFGVTLSAESSAIFAGLSTIASGASVTGSGQVTGGGSSTSAPVPTNSPSSARSLFNGYIFGATVVACVTAALSLQ
ncbi:hypothetical protein FB451DRAFT_1385000 [Mycena latifolia]|nr:hypothetical protein FB451DRAFT_1385000 [Mycena latifolia]